MRGVYVGWFGAVGSGNESSKIQAAIDLCYSRGGGFVDFDDKTYQCEIVIKSGVKLRGQGNNNLTQLQAPSVQGQPAVIRAIGPGPEIDIGLENLRVLANGHAGQHGFHAVGVALANAPFHGGVWYGTFANLWFQGFRGCGMWFQGGPLNTLLPMQFCNFYNVNALIMADAGSRGIKLTGQNGQMQFYGGDLQGQGRLASGGLLCEVGREGGLEETPVGSSNPYSVNWWGTTFQQAPRGLVLDYSFACSLVAPYFEQTKYAIRVKSASYGISVRGGKFANAASAGDGTGYLLSAESNSEVLWDGPMGDGTVENEVLCPSGVATVTYGASFPLSTSTNRVTENTTRQKAAVNTLNLTASKTFIIDSTGTTVQTINCPLYAGDTIHLTSWAGSVSYGASGNILLGGRTSPVAVPQNGCATFVRMDLGATWQLVSVST